MCPSDGTVPVSAQGPVLRPYQAAVIGGVEAEVAAGRKRVAIVAPPASGKTVTAVAIIAKEVEVGGRVVVLAHRRELVLQAARALYKLGIINHGVLLPGYAPRPTAPVQVASIATFHVRAMCSRKMELPPATLVVVDECHHTPAKTYRRILQEYPDAVIIGLTATPCRGDGRGLGSDFDSLVECPQVAELIALGFLVPTRVYAPFRSDLTGVKVERGDYVEKHLARRMDQQHLVGDVVSHWHRLAERRRTVVFATGVAHSVHLRDEFRRSGVWAEHIDGTTPTEERDEILAQLAAGTVEVVCNAMVLTEGWDCPPVSCIVLARPTRHHGLYRQMIGRVLRPAPNKVNAIILDHSGACYEHGLVEEPVIWTLSPDRCAQNPVQIARSLGQAPALTTCPECSAVRKQGQPCCCGWRPQPKPVAVETEEGELTEVGREPAPTTLDEPEHVYRQLLWIVGQRGYQVGWAAYKHKALFGGWPPRSFAGLEPLPPSAALLRWVRSENLRFAKSERAA